MLAKARWQVTEPVEIPPNTLVSVLVRDRIAMISAVRVAAEKLDMEIIA